MQPMNRATPAEQYTWDARELRALCPITPREFSLLVVKSIAAGLRQFEPARAMLLQPGFSTRRQAQ